jgi:hypothetical protein
MVESATARDLRAAAMQIFRRWGGQWNVTVGKVSGEGEARRWEFVVHTRPVVRREVSERAAQSLLRGEDESVGTWAAELRPLFEAALEAQKELG